MIDLRTLLFLGLCLAPAAVAVAAATESALTVTPVGSALSHETEIGLIDECGRLQRVAVTFAPHVSTREPVQLCVDPCQQSGQRALITVTPLAQQLGDRVLRLDGHLAQSRVPSRGETAPEARCEPERSTRPVASQRRHSAELISFTAAVVRGG